MANLDDMIQQKKQQEGFKNEDYAALQKEKDDLSAVLDRMDFDLTKKELGGFTREEVIKAAKFSLKAKSYGLEPGELKVDDSPIYYDSRHKSRWFFSRKNIKDVAEKVIEKARAKWQEMEQKKESERALALEELSFADYKITEMNEADYVPKTDAEFTEQLEKSEAFRSIGEITEHQEVMSGLENTMTLSESEDVVWDTEKAKQEDGAVLKKQLDSVDATLDTSLPSAEKMKKLVVDSIQKKMFLEIEDSHKESIFVSTKTKMKQYKERGQALLKRIDGMYAAVKAGELSPEVVKIFLKTELMGFTTMTERKIYENMVKRNGEEIPEPKPEETEEYKASLFNLTKLFRHDSSVTIQEEGNINLINYYQKLLKKGSVNKAKSEEEAKKLALSQANSFVHYKGQKYINAERNGKNSKTATRYYVTVKPGTQNKLLKIMHGILSEDRQEKGEENAICERLYFKVMGKIDDTRRDNMVIYKNDLVSDDEMQAILDKLYERCRKEDILADREHSLCATQPLEEKEGGITTAPEFDTSSLYDSFITFDLFTDKETDGALYKAINGKEATSVTKPRFSYNTYMAKAMLYSAEIISKKEGIHRNEVVNRIKNDPDINKKFKKYVSDFILLGGVDINTMKRTDKKK